MIYAYIVKKDYNHKGHSPILKLVQRYTRHYGMNDFLVCLPGYMSTTSANLSMFHDEFPKNISSTVVQNEAFFFEGMNGTRALSSGVLIKDFINGLYGGYSTSFTTKKDHSKVAVFLDVSSPNLNFIKDSKNIDDLIKKGNVKAIMIGSSNQSINSFIHIPKSADKGETDIFLVEESAFKRSVKDYDQEYNVDNYAMSLVADDLENNIILTKELTKSVDLRDIFNKILEI